MNALHKFFIKFSAQKIGADEFGNDYFENKKGKRFVVYNGEAEPSKVPMQWHGWLHYTTNLAPVNINTHHFSWQKSHLPNLTGTKHAYAPKNSTENKLAYEPWNPKGNDNS